MQDASICCAGVTPVFLLSDMQADSIPDEAFLAAEGQNVVTANFSKNKLTSIPARCVQVLQDPSPQDPVPVTTDSVFRLLQLSSSLTELNLGFNRLDHCGVEVCRLLQLTHLDLRYACRNTHLHRCAHISAVLLVFVKTQSGLKTDLQTVWVLEECSYVPPPLEH